MKHLVLLSLILTGACFAYTAQAALDRYALVNQETIAHARYCAEHECPVIEQFYSVEE